MSQHFLLSAKARTLSLSAVLRMTDEQAEAAFIGIRWAATEGKPVCVQCGCATVYQARRPTGSLRFRCKACRKDFSITSGTIFAFHKMPLRNYLAAIAILTNEVKGKSALALSRDLGVQYKTAYVLAHKLRETMASELKGLHLGGAGETVEIDGGYFGGYVKPANHRENRRDRRTGRGRHDRRRDPRHAQTPPWGTLAPVGCASLTHPTKATKPPPSRPTKSPLPRLRERVG